MLKLRLNLIGILVVLVGAALGIGYIPISTDHKLLLNLIVGACIVWSFATLTLLVFSSFLSEINQDGDLAFNERNPLWRMLKSIHRDRFKQKESMCAIIHMIACVYLWLCFFGYLTYLVVYSGYYIVANPSGNIVHHGAAIFSWACLMMGLFFLIFQKPWVVNAKLLIALICVSLVGILFSILPIGMSLAVLAGGVVASSIVALSVMLALWGLNKLEGRF